MRFVSDGLRSKSIQKRKKKILTAKDSAIVSAVAIDASSVLSDFATIVSVDAFRKDVLSEDDVYKTYAQLEQEIQDELARKEAEIKEKKSEWASISGEPSRKWSRASSAMPGPYLDALRSRLRALSAAARRASLEVALGAPIRAARTLQPGGKRGTKETRDSQL